MRLHDIAVGDTVRLTINGEKIKCSLLDKIPAGSKLKYEDALFYYKSIVFPDSTKHDRFFFKKLASNEVVEVTENTKYLEVKRI